MADDTVSIRMRLTGGKEAAREAGLVRKEMGLLPGTARTAARGTTRATSGISRALGRMRGAWTAIKRAAKIGAVAAGAAVALLAVQLKKAVTETLDLSMTVAGLHRNLGLTHKAATGWATAAKARGIETTSLNMAFKTLSQQLLQAKRGSDTAKQAFGDVGVTMGDIKKHGGDVNGMLLILAKRFGNAEGGFKRQQAAGKLLGRGYQKLLPMFATGAKGLKEQLGWSEKYHVAQNLHIKDTMGLVTAQRESKAAWAGIQTALAAELMPALTEAHGAFQDFAEFLTDPKISREEKISVIGEKIKDAMTVAFDWIVNTGMPQLASRVGQASPRIAAGFIRGFINANAWGKFIIGIWLLHKFGALGAVTRRGGKMLAMVFIRALVPAVAAEMAAGATFGQAMNVRFNKLKPFFRRWGGRLGIVMILALVTIGLSDPKVRAELDALGRGLGELIVNGLIAVLNRGFIAPINWAIERYNSLPFTPDIGTIGAIGNVNFIGPGAAKPVGPNRAPFGPGGKFQMPTPNIPKGRTSKAVGRLGRQTGSRQPIVLALDGRVVAETVVDLQENAEARR